MHSIVERLSEFLHFETANDVATSFAVFVSIAALLFILATVIWTFVVYPVIVATSKTRFILAACRAYKQDAGDSPGCEGPCGQLAVGIWLRAFSIYASPLKKGERLSHPMVKGSCWYGPGAWRVRNTYANRKKFEMREQDFLKVMYSDTYCPENASC